MSAQWSGLNSSALNLGTKSPYLCVFVCVCVCMVWWFGVRVKVNTSVPVLLQDSLEGRSYTRIYVRLDTRTTVCLVVELDIIL